MRILFPHFPPEDFGFHHTATEIWETPTDKGNPDHYKVCDGSGEDPSCSNSVSELSYNVEDHETYMNTQWIPCDE